MKLDPVSGSTIFRRDAEFIRSSVNTEGRMAELAFSSENPVPQWFGNEVLDHSPSSVRMDRLNDGAALLRNHDSNQHIGVVESSAD